MISRHFQEFVECQRKKNDITQERERKEDMHRNSSFDTQSKGRIMYFQRENGKFIDEEDGNHRRRREYLDWPLDQTLDPMNGHH